MLKRTKKALAKFLLVCMMISNVFPAYADSTENLVRTEVTEEAPETDAISETESTAEAEVPEAPEQEEAPVNGVQEEPEVKAETPEAVPEVEEVPAEPVEEAGADGDLVCAEVIEAAEAVEAEDWAEGTGGCCGKHRCGKNSGRAFLAPGNGFRRLDATDQWRYAFQRQLLSGRRRGADEQPHHQRYGHNTVKLRPKQGPKHSLAWDELPFDITANPATKTIMAQIKKVFNAKKTDLHLPEKSGINELCPVA